MTLVRDLLPEAVALIAFTPDAPTAFVRASWHLPVLAGRIVNLQGEQLPTSGRVGRVVNYQGEQQPTVSRVGRVVICEALGVNVEVVQKVERDRFDRPADAARQP